MIKIQDETELLCPRCLEMVTAEQYDVFTQSMCKTRELRRSYRSIVHMWNRPGKKKDFHFCCPYCQNWSRVNEIKIFSDEMANKLRKQVEESANNIQDGVYEEKKKAQAPKFDRDNNGQAVFAYDIEFDSDEE